MKRSREGFWFIGCFVLLGFGLVNLYTGHADIGRMFLAFVMGIWITMMLARKIR